MRYTLICGDIPLSVQHDLAPPLAGGQLHRAGARQLGSGLPLLL